MGDWYTFLGDSITAGASATSPGFAYPTRAVGMLQTRQRHIDAEVLAGPGWTSGTLLSAVFANPLVYLTGANVVTVWIGGDNIAQAGVAVAGGAKLQVVSQALTQYAHDLALLLVSIRRITRVPVVICTQYNPFPNTAVASQAVGALNASTAQVATRFGAVVAPVHAWFAGRERELIAGYRTGRIQDVLVSPGAPIHPNNKGHLLIAEGLVPVLQRAR